jgi:hypothetical protein
MLILTIGLIAHYTWYINDLSVRREEYSRLLHPVIEVEALEVDEVSQVKTTDVYFTNYHLGDGSSGTTTASGLQIKDFEVNEDGMYTYDGKVVVATANMTRLPRGIAEGYRSHELYEEFTIRLNGKEYQAITLDVCGSCFYTEGEFLQRYDIFTISNVIGKVIGQVVLEEKK